jgi:23S rRNA pseudouridine2605 synthase
VNIRLNKALAQAGVCSRRQADEFIRAGRVSVNGVAPDGLGLSVDPEKDEIRLDGRSIVLAQAKPQAYYLLHKPPGVVTTAKDPQGRTTVLTLMGQAAISHRLFPVGRLDYNSEGLIILTTDGELANRLMHPRWHLPKVYRVLVRGAVTAQALDTMRQGMTLSDGQKLAPLKVCVMQRLNGQENILEMELIQGLNRQIRRMCQDLGLVILKLKRIRQGPLALGDLPPGRHRALTQAEVKALRAAVGLAG